MAARLGCPASVLCLRGGAIAQLGERLNGIQEVGGSIPPGSTTYSPDFIDIAGVLRTVVFSATWRDGFAAFAS